MILESRIRKFPQSHQLWTLRQTLSPGKSRGARGNKRCCGYNPPLSTSIGWKGNKNWGECHINRLPLILPPSPNWFPAHLASISRIGDPPICWPRCCCGATRCLYNRRVPHLAGQAERDSSTTSYQGSISHLIVYFWLFKIAVSLLFLLSLPVPLSLPLPISFSFPLSVTISVSLPITLPFSVSLPFLVPRCLGRGGDIVPNVFKNAWENRLAVKVTYTST